MHQICYRLVASVTIAALSSSVGAAEPTLNHQSSQGANLEGQSWRLVGYHTGDGFAEVVAKPKPARFRFENGQLSGNTGCNRVSGSYTLDGANLTIGKNLASTMMACPEPLMTQEKAVTAALTSVTVYRRTDGRLELLDAEGQVMLGFQVFQSSPLVGDTWILDAYNDGKQGLASPIGGAEISLEFLEQGTIGGSDGCHRYMSGYRLEDDRLTIGPIATTRIACRGPEAVAAQANVYAAALGTVTGYRVEGRQLTLINADGKTAARFQARELPTPLDQAD